MTPWTDFAAEAVCLLEDDVDTDQMVPARFLRTATAEGLGEHLFRDRRFTADGKLVASFPLNPPHYQGQQILLAGANFGCGSSREHAPWALLDFGLRAIIAPSFADIFYNNCLKNGLLPITVSPSALGALVAQVRAEATTRIAVQLSENRLRYRATDVAFVIEPFARYCLMRGISQMEYIEACLPDVQRFEAANAARFPSLARLL